MQRFLFIQKSQNKLFYRKKKPSSILSPEIDYKSDFYDTNK